MAITRAKPAQFVGRGRSRPPDSREAWEDSARARTRSTPVPRTPFTSQLKPEESAAVLRALLDRNRGLRAEAEVIARSMLTRVGQDEVARAVEQAVLGADPEQLAARSGRKRWGYVEASEAAWGLLEEALDPFFADMKRLVALGVEEAAVATCGGIVQGLYGVRDSGDDRVLAYAVDFPAETAGHAMATLARESARIHRRRWSLPDGFLAGFSEWKEMLSRAGRGR